MLLAIYAFALLLGGILLVVSVVGGHDDPAGDVHVEDAEIAHLPDASDFLLRFFSIRNVTFGLAFFGLTGVLATTLLETHALIVLGASLSVGAFAWTVTHLAFSAARSGETTSMITPRDIEGTIAEITVPVSQERAGQVRVTIKGRRVELRARAARDQGPFQHRDQVVVVRMDGGVAEVTRF